jgi:predicted aspartyl protease
VAASGGGNGGGFRLRGAVAAAFNEPARAEALLREVLRSQPRSSAADDAYALLSQVFIRSGQYGRFLATYGEWAAAFPASAGVQRERENLEKFSGRPDQMNDPVRRSVVRHDNDGYLTLPTSIKGQAGDFILDTGAWQSAITEQLAKKLGLAVRDAQARLTDASGTQTTFRTAVVDEVMVAGTRFRNVSFAVLAGAGPFADAEIGIIGMPILLALGHFQWSVDGTAEVGGLSLGASVTAPNLMFDRHRLLLNADVLGKSVWATFDTGANTTELNANFADLFPQAIASSGKKTTSEITGIAGTQRFEAVELPEITFRIDATELIVRPAHVTLQRIPIMGGECCIGNAGHDLLKQGRGFTIDLSRMELALR